MILGLNIFFFVYGLINIWFTETVSVLTWVVTAFNGIAIVVYLKGQGAKL